MTDLGYFAPPPLPFVNRSTTLMVIGILFIIAGSIAGCFGLFTPLALLAPQNANSPPVSTLVSAFLMYVVGSAALLTIGIGAVRKRRWVRPLILAGSWILLIGGLAGLVMLIFRAPAMAEGMKASMASVPGRAAPPPAFVNAMLAMILLFALFFYLVVPILLLWIFKSENIRATLEYFDPKPRWTDRIPMPVLIMTLALALSGLMSLGLVAQGWFPVFGAAVYGPAAAVVGIVLAILFAIAAWLTARLRSTGWLLGLVLWAGYGVSWIATLLHADMREVYKHAGMNQQQLDILDKMHAYPDATMAASSIGFMVILLAFTLYARRYFDKGESIGEPSPPEAAQ